MAAFSDSTIPAFRRRVTVFGDAGLLKVGSVQYISGQLNVPILFPPSWSQLSMVLCETISILEVALVKRKVHIS
jgi:hypothetical protein